MYVQSQLTLQYECTQSDNFTVKMYRVRQLYSKNVQSQTTWQDEEELFHFELLYCTLVIKITTINFVSHIFFLQYNG